MSGGVDSSVSAHLLKQQGHEVIGLFMRTGTHTDEHDTRREGKKGCCSAIDASDARRVADRLDIPFYALDFENEFDRIIDYFADEYLTGRTPNPCVVCNSWLKFGRLWQYGKQFDADFIATGHYARAENGELHRAVDPDKDQSYVLYGIKRDVVRRLMFPLGGMHKSEVRAIAREIGLGVVADKPDSVEICFVPDNDHARLVRERRPEAVTAGNFVDSAGNVLGEHDGIERFTVGQRKGLGIATGQRRFVLQIVPATNEVVLGDRDELLATGLVATGVNWLIDPPTNPLACEVKIRYRHAGVPATVQVPVEGGESAVVCFAEPVAAVAPGQAAVFYSGTRVLGGGWIDHAEGTPR
jgi:tRNA-specific 2-thiouridylase